MREVKTRLIIFLYFIFDSTTAFAAQPVMQSKISSVAPTNINELRQHFSARDYAWPHDETEQVPLVFVKSLPPDIGKINDTHARKRLFIKTLLPIVLFENRRLQEQRALTRVMLNGFEIEKPEYVDWLKNIADKYDVKYTADHAAMREKLLQRLDEIPTSLVIAQAAIESGWGTSRFAQQGNSLFGQWTFKKGKGLTPNNRIEGANHEVRSFPDLRASVKSYLHNLNTNNAYKNLRKMRAEMRKNDQDLDAYKLASGLKNYSQRGMDYVHEVRRVLRMREFNGLDELSLQQARVESTNDYTSGTDLARHSP
jgi:Bax protein